MLIYRLLYGSQKNHCSRSSYQPLRRKKNSRRSSTRSRNRLFAILRWLLADSPATVDKTKDIAACGRLRVTVAGRISEGRNNGAAAALGRIFFISRRRRGASQSIFSRRYGERIHPPATSTSPPVASARSMGINMTSCFTDLYNVLYRGAGENLPHIPGFCFFIKRSVYEAVGGFDVDVKLAEDHELARRGSKIGTFGFLFTQCIPVSTRRFERDGKFATAIKYILCELHMLTLGPVKSNIFKYNFGHGGAIKKPSPKNNHVWKTLEQ